MVPIVLKQQSGLLGNTVITAEKNVRKEAVVLRMLRLVIN
jgi:hypothetical protein